MNEKMFLYIPVRLIKKGCITFGLIVFFSLLFKGFNFFEKKNHFKIVKSEWIEKEKNTLFPAGENEKPLANIRKQILEGDTTNVKDGLKPFTKKDSPCRDKAQWLEVLNLLNAEDEKPMMQKLQNLAVKDGPNAENAQQIINEFVKPEILDKKD